MSSDVFEKNVSELIRRGALQPDPARARERFLREVAPAEPRSWKLAAAAAAMLVAVTIVWSARTERPAGGQPGQSTKPERPEPWSGHPLRTALQDDLLFEQVILRGRLRPPKVEFHGRSKAFPEGLFFQVRVHRTWETYVEGRIVSCDRESPAGVVAMQKQEIQFEWDYRGPEIVRLEVSAHDDLQERDVVKALKIPESRRKWAFPCDVWNQDLLWRLEPQYTEAVSLAREARELAGRIEEACASEALFKSREKSLVAEAERLQSRASAFKSKSLFPASMGEVEFAARDLAVSMPIFKWEAGKFAGPKSYYTNDKLANTYRGDPFGFDAFRRYLDEAVAVAGREYLLWILRDASVSSYDENHRKLIREQALKPGVEEFAQRMLLIDGGGNGLAELAPEIRVLKKK